MNRRATVTLSVGAAETLKLWLKDLMSKLHMIPENVELDAFLELSGAIEDSHFRDKTMENSE